MILKIETANGAGLSNKAGKRNNYYNSLVMTFSVVLQTSQSPFPRFFRVEVWWGGVEDGGVARSHIFTHT